MKSANTIILAILIFLSAPGIFAQADACPIFEIIEPAGITMPGDNLSFTAEIKGENSGLIYNWTVNKGAIIGGQGTSSIEISTEGLSGETVVATVNISNLPDFCPKEFQGAAVIGEFPQAYLIERMENPTCEYRQMMMDQFFIQLQNDPNATGYIFSFGSPRRVAAVEKAMRANIKWRNFDASRIVFVNGGGKSKKPTIDYWIAPAGAEQPAPEPPVENEADFDTAETSPEIVRKPNEPYVFSSEYYDGGACIGEDQELDLEGYARFLKENPKARGNIVIIFMDKPEFREKEKEILDFLTGKGIARKRLRTFHQKTYGGVELWILP